MHQLVHGFSNGELTSFFKDKISSFVPKKDDLQFVINDKQYLSFSSLTKVGEVTFKDSNDLLVFSCKYDGVLSERSSRKRQFDVAKKVLKEDFKDGAIFVFYDNANKFRFSFIRKNYGKKGDERYSTWKRFTYFVDPNETNKTFKDRVGNCKFSDLENIQEAFSVEKLTKDFYNDLFRWYQWTLSEEIGITYPNNTAIAEDDRVKLEEQVIRLITRVLFVWFIKQKHLVPNVLFSKSEVAKVLKDFDPDSTIKGDYYNAILQNLFFATLNKAVPDRDFAKTQHTRDIKTLYRYEEMFKISHKEVLELFRSIPFLNGGLFECLDKEDLDGKKYNLDGFSRNGEKLKGHFKHRAFIPNCIFFDEKRGLIPLLERYNFTVEENAPNEVQVALDPELLGNVFENLLGAFNNETKESARKQSGSFYTPREIVDFMVSESLQAYLQQHIGEVDLNNKLTDVQKKGIYNTLLKVKILDPACGSGAFPMGVLNGIITILEKIGVAEALDMYKLKLYIIENCIYGVDLQTIASQISKLRFFISLIVEQKEKDLSKENYGVITLPNLETKFVAANTLISLRKKSTQKDLFEDPQIETTKQEILAVRHEHFYAKTAKYKKQLRDKDEKLRNKLAKLLENSHSLNHEDAKQVAIWNPYDQNASSSFFDIEWMFGVKDGFDIVIGNPPYFSLSTDSSSIDIKTGKKIKHNRLYEPQNYKVFVNSGDIYSLFYEKGWQMLKPRGLLCFITSNKWMRAGYGESTRKFFAEHTNPILLIDFAGQKIFESATVDTNILLLSNEKNQQKTLACIVKEKVLNNLSVFVRQVGTECGFSNKDSWIILSPIEQSIKEKIEAIGTPLRDWDINIYRGILTGYNEAFIIDGRTKEKLIKEDVKSAEIIRPILRGRDIKRYGYEFADLYLIATFPSLKIDIEKYPAVKEHFLSFGMERLEQTGKEYKVNGEIIKARKKTTNKWFETQDSISYWDDFSKQKIIWKIIGNQMAFSIDSNKYIVNNACYILTGSGLEYLLSVLNSKIITWYSFITNMNKTGVGDVQVGGQNVNLFPIPLLSEIEQKPFAELVKKALTKKEINKDITVLETKIENLVNELYNLTSEEADFLRSL